MKLSPRTTGMTMTAGAADGAKALKAAGRAAGAMIGATIPEIPGTAAGETIGVVAAASGHAHSLRPTRGAIRVSLMHGVCNLQSHGIPIPRERFACTPLAFQAILPLCCV